MRLSNASPTGNPAVRKLLKLLSQRRQTHGPHTNTHPRCFLGLLSCLFLAGLYVGSLYVWRSSSPRDHPSVIKRRCASVLLVSVVSPAVVKTWIHWADVSVWELMGLRMDGLVAASILPLLLTMVSQGIPYLINLILAAHVCFHALPSDVQSWRRCAGDAVWLRNQVVAPVTEELVFRGAMLPMLVPCTGPTGAIVTAPLFFGVAHFHHVIEEQRLGKESMSVILLVAGHVVGPVLCHSFCNSQGLPDISSALQHPHSSALLFSYLMGGLLFLVLLFPLTDQYFYGPIPICSLAPPPGSVC
uniref:CAAX prenyl protease 2 n=1 Tax=Neolamprologus brichardi TaxID=32507 RepID=A0A3Q4M0V5_NEOBR